MTRNRRPASPRTDPEAAAANPAADLFARAVAAAVDPVTGALYPHSPAAAALPWPDEVPVLTADDLTAPPEPDVSGKRRAVWVWLRETFPPGASAAGDPQALLYELVRNQLGLLLEDLMPGACRDRSLRAWAETHTKAETAAMWAALLRRLRYDVPDEPKPRKRRGKAN